MQLLENVSQGNEKNHAYASHLSTSLTSAAGITFYVITINVVELSNFKLWFDKCLFTRLCGSTNICGCNIYPLVLNNSNSSASLLRVKRLRPVDVHDKEELLR